MPRSAKARVLQTHTQTLFFCCVAIFFFVRFSFSFHLNIFYVRYNLRLLCFASQFHAHRLGIHYAKMRVKKGKHLFKFNVYMFFAFSVFNHYVK